LFVAKNSRPYATAGGNSTSVCARKVQATRNGGAREIPRPKRWPSRSCPYTGHAIPGSTGFGGGGCVATNSIVEEPWMLRDACLMWR
jgi:hypothetical protein